MKQEINDTRMMELLGSESTPENVRAFYGGMTLPEIEESLNQTFPYEVNSDLAEAVYYFCNS